MLKIILVTSGIFLSLGAQCLWGQKKEKINIVCDGNSLTYGQGVARELSYPSQLQTLFNKDSATGVIATVHNIGINGQTTTEMLFAMRERLKETFDSRSDRNVLVACEIRNHLVRHCTGRMAALDAYMTYCQRAAEMGFEVYSVTLLPSWSGSYCGDSTDAAMRKMEEDRVFVNRYISKNFKDFSNGLVDVTSLSTIGYKGANLPDNYVFSQIKPGPTAYYLDGTHLNAEGNKEVAELVKEIIMSEGAVKSDYSFDSND